MSNDTLDDNFSQLIAAELPYLRRYTRALTGSQARGDQYTANTLELIIKDKSAFENDSSTKVNLFKCFHAIWTTSGQGFASDEGGPRRRALDLLAKLTNNSREALLLRTIENFTIHQIAEIIQVDDDEVRHLLNVANKELSDTFKGSIMIIEDEPIIAADLKAMVEGIGHDVTGIARTRDDAVAMGKHNINVDLILADIQLADNSSGIDAVNDLLETIDVPVIFITAFPERLLTGDRPEPAFLITKPFREAEVLSAVSQAMFFASTETLKA